MLHATICFYFTRTLSSIIYTVGSRALSVAAAKIWNALPDSFVSMTSLQTFRRHLKTFLFQRSFRYHYSGPGSSFKATIKKELIN